MLEMESKLKGVKGEVGGEEIDVMGVENSFEKSGRALAGNEWPERERS